MNLTADITAIQTDIDRCEVDASASEVHGIVTALICRQIDGVEMEDNLILITGYQHLNSDAADILLNCMDDLYHATQKALDDGDFSFALLIPGDSADIEARTRAIAEWCQGYLLALFHEDSEMKAAHFSETVQEALGDILSIAAAESSGIDEETETRALTELEEFLRISITLIYEEMREAFSARRLH